MSAAFLRCVCNAVQDNDVQAALQRMLALESQLRETDSPQFSVPVFPPGNGSSGVWPSRILASTSFVRWFVGSLVGLCQQWWTAIELIELIELMEATHRSVWTVLRIPLTLTPIVCTVCTVWTIWSGGKDAKMGMGESDPAWWKGGMEWVFGVREGMRPEQEMSKDRSMSGDKKLLEWREPGCEVELQT